MFALNFAHPRDVAGVALIDSMHPEQSESLFGMQPILAMLPTLARTGLARLLFSPGGTTPRARRSVSSATSRRSGPSSPRPRA
jgi:hypothetical protein